MPFSAYYKEIQAIYNKNPNAKEHSYRTPLQNLWKGLYGRDYPILHEGSSEQGTPDFTISNGQGHTVGFIECKDYNFNLHDALSGKKSYKREHEQLIKYLKLATVVIFTNYLHFILVKDGENGLEILAECTLDGKNGAELQKIFEKFLQAKPLPVKNQDAFIKTLAQKTHILRDDILAECGQADSYFTKSDIHKLFSQTIYKDLEVKDFADSFAQIITFGLLFTRLTDKNTVSIDTFSKIPQFIPLFRELLSKFNFAEALGIRYILDSIIETINLYDESMFFKGGNYKDNHDSEDPFIYMYENFLKEFDAETRNARGVFYTPIEVVGYIVRSIDELLKTRLGLGDGLRHQGVHILDFATGTGTFLLGAIEHIYRGLENSGSGGLWKSQVKDFILKNLYGFEYLVVPYVLAHFRIHRYLEDCGYSYEKADRLKLYLTNTLDNGKPDSIPMFPELNTESSDAHRIKNEEPILVIMGNPPYNSSSDAMNCKDWIMKLTESYKEGLGEKKLNLNDDYIKFLRFAHWKMERVDKGVVAVITNNSFIGGITHREMRAKLMQTFDEIYIYDLHGNGNKGEKCPDGSPDLNIFNIQAVGVCIALFVKTGRHDGGGAAGAGTHRGGLPHNNPDKGIYHQEIFGTQTYKKQALLPCSWQDDIKDKKWQKLGNDAKWHWFVPRSTNARYWDEFVGLGEIFENINSGIETKRDELFIEFDKDTLDKRMNLLQSGNLSDAFITMYNARTTPGYDLDQKIKNIPYQTNDIKPIHYRPFDFRYVCYNDWIGRTRFKTLKHLIGHENMGLIFVRQQAEEQEYDQVFITDKIIDRRMTLSNRGAGFVAPLYLYGNKGEGTLGLEEAQKPNWTPAFAKFLQGFHCQNPEQLLAYMYAILYAPSYRSAYGEDLSYDYPRIPFTTDTAKFATLAQLGQRLIDLHLLKTAPQTSAGYPVDGGHRVDAVRYSKAEGRTPEVASLQGGKSEAKLFINDTQYFSGVSTEVWEYQIGGYQVLDKYLKARRGRALTLDEISHFQRVCGILADTIKIQKEIDTVKGVW